MIAITSVQAQFIVVCCGTVAIIALGLFQLSRAAHLQLTKKIDELQKWKESTQQALIHHAVIALDLGFKPSPDCKDDLREFGDWLLAQAKDRSRMIATIDEVLGNGADEERWPPGVDRLDALKQLFRK